MILRDCPRCGRTNVQGQVYLDKTDKTMKAIDTALFATLGAVVAGIAVRRRGAARVVE